MISFAVFVFGLAIGSFLNVIIYRLGVSHGLYPHFYDRENQVIGLFQGRSFCDTCGHQLSWGDLIPLLSFVVLRGRCRYCQQKISLQYPLVELATGLLFLALFMFTGTLAELRFLYVSYLWTMAAFLIVIFVYDLKHFLIPDKIVYLAIGLAFLWRVFEFQSILAGIGAAAFFLAIFLVSKGRWIGFGDVKLAFLLGLFLGWPLILIALFSAFCLGAIVGLCLIALHKKGLKSEVPFAPFLIMGTAMAFFFGESIFHWYLGLFLV